MSAADFKREDLGPVGRKGFDWAATPLNESHYTGNSTDTSSQKIGSPAAAHPLWRYLGLGNQIQRFLQKRVALVSHCLTPRVVFDDISRGHSGEYRVMELYFKPLSFLA